jgi:hypothetical protein
VVKVFRSYVLLCLLAGVASLLTLGCFGAQLFLDGLPATLLGAVTPAVWLYCWIVVFRALGLLYRDYRVSLEWE